MPWLNFVFPGAFPVDTTDDAQTGTVEETGTTQINIPQNIRLTDIIQDITSTDVHQYSIWTSGRKQSSNLSGNQLNPASQGRFHIDFVGFGLFFKGISYEKQRFATILAVFQRG